MERVQLAGFEYSELDVSKKEIRLVKLLPGEFNHPIRVEIIHAPLTVTKKEGQTLRWPLDKIRVTLPDGWTAHETFEDRIIFEDRHWRTSWDHPDATVDRARYDGISPADTTICSIKYEALSYVWGQANAQEPLLVRDPRPNSRSDEWRILRIRPLLAEALRYLRYTDRPRTMWIDAICINQDDTEERNKQVHRMGEIFSLAHRVVAWLGPSTPDSQYALETIDGLAETFDLSRERYILRAPGWEGDTVPWDNSQSFDDHVWQAFNDLLDRDWFRRLWVLQEIQLASKYSIIKCGVNEISWPRFRRAVTLPVQRSLTRPGGISNTLYRAITLCYVAKDLRFEILAAQTGAREFSEPRDRVYGVLNLMSPVLARSIPVDYTLSIVKLFGHVFRAWSDLTRRLNLLRFNPILSPPSDNGDVWPSWLPDLNSYVTGRLYPLLSIVTSAAGQSRAHTVYLSDTELSVAGFHMASVSFVEAFDVKTYENITSLWTRRGPGFAPNVIDPNGETQFDALVQLLTLEYMTADDFLRSSGLLLDAKSLKDLIIDLASRDLSQAGALPDNAGLWRSFGYLKGKALFTTKDGYVGIGLSSMCPEDKVAVLLGCDFPVILRPLPTGQYQFVSGCLMHGIMYGEAILGSIPPPWQVRVRARGKGDYYELEYYNPETEEYTAMDPRLEGIPIPPEWQRKEFTPTPEDPNNCCKFINKVTTEDINYDPRMSMDAINERGLPGQRKVEMIQLV
ncbi:putative Heterokaryon incompatibility domain-containing protein [Seiridium unicorne]|uniref:Heterokaryon incompatibility domain-containing protein n=1 Tax=Seiridium unicorne TaxID=138068 RepID=A0ABR2UMP6_9PEZI